MAKTIGILYLCTGPYRLFWDDFYDSLEANFLPETEKRYFVFCDDLASLEGRYGGNGRVRLVHLDAMPWPLITLLRFRFFLSIEDELEGCDYLMFSNANIACEQAVTEAEFLPRGDAGENMSFVQHPGFWRKPACNAPLERSRRSLAYVPYNCKTPYVIGAMFAGEAGAFLRMSHVLNDRIEADLKRNVIAHWHDESHLNRYVANRTDCRLLGPDYCYPWGFDLPVARKLVAVDKASKFDVAGFKGMEGKPADVKALARKALNKLCSYGYLQRLRDAVLMKRVEEL